MVILLADYYISYNGSCRYLKPIVRHWSVDVNRINLSIVCEGDPSYNSWRDNYFEKNLSFHREIAKRLPDLNGFLLHGAAFDVDGEGVVFCALSGTGKTTQMLNWQKLLGDKMTIVNGDKPIIRFFDKDFCEQKGLEIPEGTEYGIPYAYGTPWNGKERFGCNMRTPLKHICFIERSDKNFVTKIEKADTVERIMKQVYIPKDPEALSKTLQLVNRLINSCELWIIHCNMEPESAEIAYKTIFGK